MYVWIYGTHMPKGSIDSLAIANNSTESSGSTSGSLPIRVDF